MKSKRLNNNPDIFISKTCRDAVCREARALLPGKSNHLGSFFRLKNAI